MLRDIALDPVTGDLDVSGARLRLTAGAEAVRQRLDLRLSLWQGEYLLDQRVGMPYAKLLGQKGAQAQLEATLRRAIATCPGVEAITSWEFRVDAERGAHLSFEVRTTSGAVVAMGGFIAEGLS